MTRQKSFEGLVRMRIETTGKRYAAARTALFAAEQPTWMGGGIDA